MYKHNQIILVNSGSTGYGEFPLHSHTLLKASGNRGKSSILNALKFFWLPETSLTGAEKKFKFVNKQSEKGFYSGEETFGYYFPTAQTSFIILEIENNHGTCCHILYPRSRMGYGRIMARCAYSEIQDLFWDKEADDELGFGHPVEGLTTKGVLAELTIRDIDFREVNKIEELKNLLYSDSLMEDDAVFSIFPLKSNDDKSISDLCTLLHTLCGFKAESKEMALLFASIIESGKKDDSDHLQMDLHEILQERDALKGEEKLLNQLESYREVANEILSISNNLGLATDEVGLNFLSATASIEKNLTQVIVESKEIEQAVVTLKNEYNRNFVEGGNLRDQGNILRGSLKTQKEAFEQASSIIQKGEEVVAEFNQVSLSDENEILDILQEDLVVEEEILKKFQDKDALANRLAELSELKTSLESRIESLNVTAANFDVLLFKKLSADTQVVLSTLNPLFKSVVGTEFGDSDVVALESFSQLFTQDGDKLKFGNMVFDVRSPEFNEEKLKKDLADARAQLEDTEAELKEFKDFSTGDEQKRRKKMREHTKNIKKLNADMKAFRKYRDMLEEMPSITASYESTLKQIDETDAKQTEYRNKTENARKEHLAKVEEEKLLKSKALSLKGMLDRLQQASNTNVFSVMLQRVDTKKVKDDLIISSDDIDLIARRMGAYSAEVSKLQSKLTELVSDNIIEDVSKLCFEVDATYYSLKPLANTLKDKFDQIEPRRINLTDNKAAHKSLICMKMQELQSNAEVIETYRSRFNRMFNEVQINNLEGVKVVINLDTRFNDLVAQINSNDLRGEADISESFYDRLGSFIDAFFTGGETAELTMDKIIKSVSFKTKKRGQDWVETGQSTSTVTLISVPLFQKMMKEVMNPDIKVSIPLVIDELAHIDESEMAWLLQGMEEEGFRLLGASTNNISVYTLEAIGSECCIDEFQASKAYSLGRNNVFFGAEGAVDV